MDRANCCNSTLEWNRIVVSSINMVNAAVARGARRLSRSMLSKKDMHRFLAAKFGDLDAKAKLDFLETRMTPEQITEAEGKVTIWIDGHESLLASQ